MSNNSDNNSEVTGYETTEGYYLPDLNKPQAVLGMLLSIELFVGSLALMKYPIGSIEFLSFFGGLSFLMLWIGIVFALLMHSLKPFLRKQNVFISTVLQLMCLLLIATIFTYMAKTLLVTYLSHTNLSVLLLQDPQQFYLNNVWLCLLVGGLLMRYFYIAHQNQEKIKAISVAQVQALQSRIRPHFLFNSLNSIASLVRIDPELAEQSVEDLADLFRASLSESTRRVSLKEELEIARLYQRIEQLRLGERLTVKWQVKDLPVRQKVPVLIIQPLLENAIYHGIEPRTSGGTVSVIAQVTGKGAARKIEIAIENPLPEKASRSLVGVGPKQGNKIAMKNIEQRLRLVYGDDKARVDVSQTETSYSVRLIFPYEENTHE
jgi:two-component system sensor histidine kinase AlgZ